MACFVWRTSMMYITMTARGTRPTTSTKLAAMNSSAARYQAVVSISAPFFFSIAWEKKRQTVAGL